MIKSLLLFFKTAPLSQVRQKALDRIELLIPATSTRLIAALGVASRQLDSAKAGRKHMIILTDGELPDGAAMHSYYLELVEEMALKGVTLSTFIIGNENASLLQEMAKVGGGNFHRTRDVRSLPKLFLDDIKVNVGERTQKENQNFSIRTKDLKSTDIKSYPKLLGYVETKKKELATLELVLDSQEEDPLLASWNYGKGKVIAYTSDVSGRWSNRWIKWKKFHTFWSNIIDSARNKDKQKTKNTAFDLRFNYYKGNLLLNLSLFSKELTSSINTQLKLPDGEIKNISFEEITPGHYKALIKNPQAGKYEFSGEAGKQELLPIAFNLDEDLFGEKNKGFNLSLLERLASLTGGKVNPEINDLNSQSYEKIEKKELGFYFFLAALLILLIDILLRERKSIRI